MNLFLFARIGLVMLPLLAGPPGAVPGEGRTLYVTNRATDDITVFTIASSGRLDLAGGRVRDGDEPRGLVFSPDGRRAYVVNGDDGSTAQGAVAAFSVSGDGGLTSLGAPVGTRGDTGFGIAIAPEGGALYVSNIDSGTVTAFAVRSDGRITRIGEPVTTGSDRVFGFSVGGGGSLSPVPGSPFAVADFPEGVAVSPDGRLLFVTSPGSERPDNARAVSAFTIGDDGALGPVPGSPFPAGQGPVGVSTTPDGRRLYVSNFDSGDVSGFDIAPNGVLRVIGGSPFPTGGLAPSFQSVSVRPDQGPVASFSAATGRTATFDASASSDPDGVVARYDWDFGDGAVLNDGGPRPAHVYARTGTFRVTLTVTDDEGCATRRVFTGQTALCNGSRAARTTRSVTVG